MLETDKIHFPVLYDFKNIKKLSQKMLVQIKLIKLVI
jgi:hypothetical protein